jgi:hypothetical protein
MEAEGAGSGQGRRVQGGAKRHGVKVKGVSKKRQGKKFMIGTKSAFHKSPKKVRTRK